MGAFVDILRGFPWYAWLGVVAILSGTTRSIIAMTHRHEQRMAMIKRGLDPAANKDDDIE